MSICLGDNLRNHSFSFTWDSMLLEHCAEVYPWFGYILTSTKNASLIISDFLAVTHKNEQPRTAYLCKDWTRLENDINLTCR